MNLHEFQAKAILARHGIPVPAGQVAGTPDEVTRVAADLGGSRFAVKAQILAGGRGEAGGVKLADSVDQVREIAAEMLGSRLITAQTPSAGDNVRRVYVEQAVACAREIYVGLLVDRNEGCVVLLGAGQGGEEVEKLLRGDPKSLVRLALLGTQQPGDADLRQFAEALGLTGSLVEEAAGLLAVLARAFVEPDARLIEVNPLCLTEEGRLVALDVKMVVDDNALFRQPDIQSLRDEDEVDALELEAQRHDLNFFRMDGNIGVVVNGAGLALATHDILHDLGGAPANFMDIRTTAMSLQIAKGIGLLLADPAVKVILVNVHGSGMTGCDMIVEAIHIAMRWSGRKILIVFRAAGQNAEYARRLMAILVDRDTRLIVQGMTGRAGTFYTDQAMEYGTRVVAGIRPGKGGSRHFSLSRLRSCGGGDARNGRQCKPRLRAGASGRRRDHRGCGGGGAAGDLRHRTGSPRSTW